MAPRGLWREPDFLKLWAGQAVSQIGSWITLVGLPLTAALLLKASPLQMEERNGYGNRVWEFTPGTNWRRWKDSSLTSPYSRKPRENIRTSLRVRLKACIEYPSTGSR